LETLSEIDLLWQTLFTDTLPKLVKSHPQTYSAIQACLLYSHGMFHIAALELKRMNLLCCSTFLLGLDLLSSNHYPQFARKLGNWSLSNPSLTFSVKLKILESTDPSVYALIAEDKLPTCPYFLRYIKESPLLEQMFPGLAAIVRDSQVAEADQRTKELDQLIAVEAENALKKSASLPAKGGKKHSEKNNVKVLPKPSNHDVSYVSTLACAAEVPSSHETVSRPVDQRERDYAILMVGEYLLEHLLRPAIRVLKFEESRWSWHEILEAIELELDVHLASRKHFLRKCIEFVRKRNAVAHPLVRASGQLLKDLNQVKAQLDIKTTEEISGILQKLNVKADGRFEKGLDGFGRKDLGFTSASIQQCISIMRLTEFLITQTVLPFFEQQGTSVTLGSLKELRDSNSAADVGLTSDQLAALCVLLEKRNTIAHPKPTAKMIRGLIAVFLVDDPDHGTFLSYIAR